MKILIIAAAIPSEKDPLSGIFSYDQAMALKASGDEVLYLVVDMRSIRSNRKIGFHEMEKNGMKCGCMHFPLGPVSISIRNKVGTFLLNRLYDKFRDYNPDVIHAHFNEMGSISLSLSQRLQVPLVITEHSSTLSSGKIKKAHFNSIIRAYSNADKVIAVSKALSDHIKRHTGIKTSVIGNIVDTDSFRVTKRSDRDFFNIVNVGNLVPIKNHTLLLESYSIFHKNHPKTHLYIIGHGTLREELQKKCIELGINESVTFKGRLSRKETADVFHNSDVFAFTSISETFGVSCIEALAAGVPVVSTNCGGPNDFIDKRNGVIVDSTVPHAFAEALDNVYTNYNQYDRNEISRDINERYSSSSIAKKLNGLYSEILNTVC